MHVKFYHRVCFQSTWRGGFEGGEHYYSPPGASPPPRVHRRRAGSQTGWTQPGLSSPGRERWLIDQSANMSYYQHKSDLRLHRALDAEGPCHFLGAYISICTHRGCLRPTVPQLLALTICIYSQLPLSTWTTGTGNKCDF